MVLKASYTSLDDVPSQFHELFEEKDGKFVIQVEGLKTEADMAPLREALRKERSDHAATKKRLQQFGDLEPEELQKQLDELEDLRAEKDARGPKDDDKIQILVDQRVKREKAPLERELEKLRKEAEELREANAQLDSTLKRGKIETALRKAAEDAKILSTAIEDVVAIGERLFEIDESGAVLVKDNVGFTPGEKPEAWLSDMKEKRPHWWAMSQGGGAQGGKDGGGSGAGNPWAHDTWNMTKQGEYLKQYGSEKAAAMAKAAGTSLGGGRPPAKSA